MSRSSRARRSGKEAQLFLGALAAAGVACASSPSRDVARPDAGEAGVANPFAWEPARPVSPPVLVARSVAESAGAALEEGPWRERIALLETIGPGVNAESLVATGATQPAHPAGTGRSRGRGAERGG